MRRLGILGLAGLALALWTLDAAAQMGGAVRGGVRGAVVGGAIGGEGAATAGAVIGATRGAMNNEAVARAQYQTTNACTNAQLSNFNTVPPEVLVVPTTGAATKGGETIIKSKDGKPALGVTYPDDWQQKTGDHFVTAVSKDGHAWAVVATMEGVKDKAAGIEKVKDGITKSLSDIKYDEAVTTAKGALMVTGTGKTKKSGVAVVFAAAVVDSGPGQLAGAVFVVDDNVDQFYKDTVRYICSTIKLAKDLAK